MSTPRLRNWRLAALAAPATPMAALTLPMTIYIPEFFANALGLNRAVVGLLFTIVRTADLVFDPLIGELMDRSNTRWGQFRPWLVLGTPIVMAGTAMLFMAQPGVGPAYLAIGLVLAYAGFSIITLSQMGLSSGISTDYRERSRVFAWWQGLYTSGLMLVMAVPVIFAGTATDSGHTVRSMGWFVLVMAPVTAAMAVLSIREKGQTRRAHSTKLSDYLALLRLRSARRLLLTALLIGLGLGISAAVFIFYFTILKQVPRPLIGLQFVVFFFVGVNAAPLWSLFANRIGKHRALAINGVGYASYMLFMLTMPPGNLLFFYLAAIWGGAMASGAEMLPRSMMADVSDECQLKTGRDHTGILFALLTVTWKLGQAFAIGIVYVALDLIGFDARSGISNPSGALLGVMLLYGAVPAACYLLASLVIRRYDLTRERHAEIRATLESNDRSVPPVPESTVVLVHETP